MRRALLAQAALVVMALGRPAAAGCPDEPAALCRPYTALLLPSAFAVAYAPDDLGTWYGGGAEILLLTWSDNSPAFGPSQGKLRFDVAMLGTDTEGAGPMVMYRGGAAVSFERNASRQWLIPWAGANLGGLWTDATGSKAFVDAGGGVYLLYLRSLIVDLEVSWVFPFNDADRLAGLRGQLAVSFSLW
jgi:hypothetical protein